VAKCAIGFDDRCGPGTVTTSSALSTMPGSNLQVSDMSLRWQTANGTTSASLTLDMGALYTIGASVLDSTNLSLSGTARFRASSTDPTMAANVLWDSGAFTPDPAFRYTVAVSSAPVSVRYCRWDLADATVSVLTAARWWVFRTLRPSVNYALPAKRLFQDPSDVSYAQNRSARVLERPTARGFEITLPGISQVEHDTYLEPLQRISGKTRDVMLCLDAASADLGRDTVVGLLDQTVDITRPAFNRYAVPLRVYERI
jgi:hypothetical protein